MIYEQDLINKPNLHNIEQPLSTKKRVSQAHSKKKPSSPIKIITETNQRPKWESFARKTSMIENKENTEEKLEDNLETKDYKGNVYNESNNNQNIDNKDDN